MVHPAPSVGCGGRPRFPWQPARLLQTFRYSLKVNPSQHVSRQTSFNRYATYGFINSSNVNTPASRRTLQTRSVTAGSRADLAPEDAELPRGQEQTRTGDEHRAVPGAGSHPELEQAHLTPFPPPFPHHQEVFTTATNPKQGCDFQGSQHQPRRRAEARGAPSPAASRRITPRGQSRIQLLYLAALLQNSFQNR